MPEATSTRAVNIIELHQRLHELHRALLPIVGGDIEDMIKALTESDEDTIGNFLRAVASVDVLVGSNQDKQEKPKAPKLIMAEVTLGPGERMGEVQLWKTEMLPVREHDDVLGPDYKGTIIVFLKNGDHLIGLAEDFAWCHHGIDGDIIAWAPYHRAAAPEPAQAPAPEPEPAPEPALAEEESKEEDDGPAEGYYRVERSGHSSRYGFSIVCRDGSARFDRIEDGRASGMSKRCADVIQKALEEDLIKWRKEQGKC